MAIKNKTIEGTHLSSLIKEGNWDAVIRSQARQVKWLYNNSSKTSMVVDEKLVWLMLQNLQDRIRALENPPAIKDPSSTYDKKMGNDRICQCGHSYFQHFDSFENMRHIGCKYCGCYDFKEKQNEPIQQV